MAARETFPDTYESFRRSRTSRPAIVRWTLWRSASSLRRLLGDGWERERGRERRRARRAKIDEDSENELLREAAAREEQLRLRKCVVYVAGLQRGRHRGPAGVSLKWWRTPVQRAHGWYIVNAASGEGGENEKSNAERGRCSLRIEAPWLFSLLRRSKLLLAPTAFRQSGVKCRDIAWRKYLCDLFYVTYFRAFANFIRIRCDVRRATLGPRLMLLHLNPWNILHSLLYVPAYASFFFFSFSFFFFFLFYRCDNARDIIFVLRLCPVSLPAHLFPRFTATSYSDTKIRDRKRQLSRY
jgi:hypothetical protein